MTHQNYQTNGASLEDCHTNFFALADLCGIKWRKFVLNERPQATGDPLDDPVLKSYTKCLAKDILCVWRRVSQHKNELDQTGGLGMFDISQNVYPTVTHPPLSLTAAKELWIFWYGEEPDLTDLVSPELLKASDVGDPMLSGSWETGLSYECRSLLFKALHNLIEKCLLSRDIIRLGKWFVQPCTDNNNEKSSAHLSFSFAFFVHGDSTVCASMDIREHPPVRTLTEEYLNEVIKNSQHNLDNCDVEDKDEFRDINHNISMQSVILAPFGLSAVLTGNKSENFEQNADKIVNDWNTFYPMKKNENEASSKVPQVVEVISGGVKMLYPSKYVLVTDIDIEKKTEKCFSEPNKKCADSEKKILNFHEIERNSVESKVLSLCDGIHKSAAGAIPERIWQDMVMNPAYTNQAEKTSNADAGLWNFVEPCLKSSCSCKRSGNLSTLSKAPGNSSSLSGKSNFRNNSYRTRTPFHKRSESSLSKSKDRFSNDPSLPSKFNIRSNEKAAVTSNEVQQNSIGSVGSIIASPFQQSLSVHSQPSSVPINDQNIISPMHQNDASPHPLTPIIENNIDQKPDIQSLKNLDNQNKEQDENSQPNTTVNAEFCDTPRSDINRNAQIKQAESFSKENQSLKRPALMIRDCENNVDEDFSTNLSLYDYSTWDAWMNHPIKRFKADDMDRNKSNRNIKYDLYAGHKHTESSLNSNLNQIKPNFLQQNIKSELGGLWKSTEESKNLSNSSGSAKDSKNESEPEKLPTESLFTSEGLQPSYADLTKIFDNSDDNSNDDHLVVNTPPGSNKSNVGHPDIELSENETKRDKMTFSNFTNINNNGLTSIMHNVNSSNLNTLGIRNEELSKMFPTPPSIEQHTNSSPGGICGNVVDNLMESIDTIVSHKMDTYPNFGSPQEEQIEDWSYVFFPSKMSCIVGSTKYSPLNNLSVHTLAPIVLPSDCTYTPSWIKQKEQEEVRRKQQKDVVVKQPEAVVKKEPEKSIFEIKKEIKSEPMSPMNVSKPNMSMHNLANAKSNENNNTIINKLLSQGPNISSNIYLNNNRQMENASFQNNFNSSYGNMMSTDSMFRKSMGIMSSSHHSQPPPPYDVAIHSPSLNSNLNMANASNNNNDELGNNSKRISNVKGGSFMRQNSTQMIGGNKVAEANSLLVNVLLYDTSLNIFRDHNFDSCTICVCNETTKSVGNIRGTDSGIYLSLSTNCHFNSNLTSIMDKLFESKSNAHVKEHNRYMGNSRNLINSLANNNESPYSISLTTTSCSSSNDVQHSPLSNGMEIIPQMDTIPSFMNALNTSGYADDDPIFCRCGFSAVINRRLAHQTGLFYEDEMEITGMAKDPALNKKQSLALLLSKQQHLQQQQQMPQSQKEIAENKLKAEEAEKDHIQDLALYNNNNISLSIFDLVRDQCTLFQNSSNTIQRAIKHLNSEKYSPLIPNRHVNLLEFIDALDIISLALEQSKYAFEKFDGYNNRQTYMAQHQKQSEKKSLLLQHAISVHKWPFLNAAGPKSNQDIIRVMKSMKVLLQKAFNQNGTTGLWDAPYAVRGPLTWREFHRLAGRGIGQCEPQPIPSIVVGHDKEWLCVSPYALQFWDKLLLEPYSYPRDIAYIVVTPDNEFISSKVKAFFKELSTTYEMCRLGKHQPVKGWEGILKVGSSILKPRQESKINEDDWLRAIDQSRLNEFLKLYDAAFHQYLVPYLSKIPNDKTLLNPPESFYNYKDHHHHQKSSSLPSPMRPPNTPESNSMSASGNLNSSLMCDKGPNTPKSDHDMDTKENLNPSCSDVSSQQAEQLLNPPHIVLYIVEPFTGGTDSSNLERVACLALLKQYSNILNSIPESVKTNISIQIIAQESILELGKNRDITRWSDHMRNLALSVFTQSYRYLAHSNNVKSLTGFGTAATAEIFLKSKDEKNRTALKLYTPPYILSTRHAKSENSENFGQSGMEQQCQSIMYCCYCLSEDQSMLLGVVTDERGEFIESCAINIDVPNRKRRRKSSARRIGLKKLMDFILGVMSQTVKPWRLVVGRIGRIGHGELKGWSWLLSKPNLVKASKYLKDICKQCSVMYPQAVPSIWSACLVTLEPDSSFRVMPDQFTPDERFSQRSTQSPLSTPQDVTCTHILVFPTSAISQSSQTAFQEQHLENPFDMGEDLNILALEDDDVVEDDINGIQHLFDECWNESAVGISHNSPTRDSHRDSPVPMDENKSRQSPGMTDPQSGSSRAMYAMQEAEEFGQLLQQPLALGYLVSTAPTGRMPTWFWASCPHLENVCPVFLKTSLHIHSPSIHKENDDIYFREQTSKIEHPLDSNTTADVLRYVLEGYNVLSWLAMDSNTHDRLSCLPIHVQMLMQLYHLHTALT